MLVNADLAIRKESAECLLSDHAEEKKVKTSSLAARTCPGIQADEARLHVIHSHVIFRRRLLILPSQVSDLF
jgi:hypothetical protein